ncbi:MAG TPA: SpoIIE family protein phosphatase, partial [Thermoleophilaceae bacterium]
AGPARVFGRRSNRQRDELEGRARQQAAIAAIGQRALGGIDLEQLLDEAAEVFANELRTDYIALMELTGDRRGLLVRAGRGLPDGLLGGVLPVVTESLLGHALHADTPIVVPDTASDRRFEPSAAQSELGIVSALGAPIGARGRHFGVIAAGSRSPMRFSPEDAHFAQALANVVGAAVERARGEERVRDSEARFRELADTTPALMWTTDAEGHVSFVNEGWLRFTGHSLAEELGDTFALSAHPDDLPGLLAGWRKAFGRREELRMEYRLRRHDGEYRWVVEVGVPRFQGGDFIGYVGTATDIHERKAMEEALRESEQGFRELADQAPVMIWTTDRDGLVTFVNESWLRYTGTTLEQELGASWELGVHPDDLAAFMTDWDESLAHRRPWEHEYRLRRRDGDYRWVVDRGVPRYEHGDYAGYVGTAVDIHERKLLEARLREVAEREHEAAETLQRSLLPERLPQLEGMKLAARYLPAGAGAAIGGDWYDALELEDGRVAVVVGDVVGHGLRAAATMGQLRNAFRAYGLLESSPAEVMGRVNRLLGRDDQGAMATVLYLVIDRERGEVVYSSAGHPPPLVLAPGESRFLEGGRSVPVGAADPVAFREARATLPPGATLLLYTDGLVERRDTPLADRLVELAVAAGAAAGELEQLCDQVLSGVLGPRDPGDDVALLAVRLEAASAGRLALTLPADPGTLGPLRRRLARFLHAAGADEHESYEITLTVCEAAGNAIEHAYGPGDASFQVEAELQDDTIVAIVTDQGLWRERRGENRGRGLAIIEGLMDEVRVSREEGGTTVHMCRRLRHPARTHPERVA